MYHYAHAKGGGVKFCSRWLWGEGLEKDGKGPKKTSYKGNEAHKWKCPERENAFINKEEV